MDRREVLPDVREETVEDLKAKWETWPETKQPKPRSSYDDVSNPVHYAGNGDITCKDALHSMMYGAEAFVTPKVGYWWGCAFKYIWRAFLKGDPKKDLMKAKQCIDEMLDLI